MDNFKAAEALERMLDTSDIPIVPALDFTELKMLVWIERVVKK